MDPHPNYLAWMRNKYNEDSHFLTPMTNMFSNSWEEQAFTDDVAFIWPPRSYSCSFCKRKFRSAQALGGHMNVHRRDRARLKLSQNEALSTHPNYDLSPRRNPNFLALSNSPIVLDKKIGFEKNVRSREDMGDVEDEVNLSIGLNVVVSDHNEGVNSKRLKYNVLSMPLFLEPCSKGLDLELRLGDLQKDEVKKSR